MHNRTQSEDVIRPQAFSRAQVRPRHNHRLTLANLERLPVPEPPQVTSKSDLGSIGSRSSSERSRNKLADIRQRELELFEQSEDEEEEEEVVTQKQTIEKVKVLRPTEEPVRKISPSHDALRNLALQQNRNGSREGVRLQEQNRNQSHERLKIHEQRQTLRTIRRTEEKEHSQERSRSCPKQDESVPKESASKPMPEVVKQTVAGLFAKPAVSAAAEAIVKPVAESTINSTSKDATSKPVSEEPAPKASSIPTPDPSPEPEIEPIRPPTKKPLEAPRPAPPPQVRVTTEVDEDSDLIHITRMGNRLESLSTNLNDVRAGMENISKMTNKPTDSTNLLLVRMSDHEVFEAVIRDIWSRLWTARRDTNSWKGFRLGPGFWLLLLLTIPLYALMETVACMIWCRPVFADGMEGLGIYPDAPELPFVIPTMLLRPLRPVWKPLLEVVEPVGKWVWEFVAYVTANDLESQHEYQ